MNRHGCPYSSMNPEQFVSQLFSPEFQKKVVRNLGEIFKPTETEEEPSSTSQQQSDKFIAKLNVKHYKSEEISVKISGKNTVIVEGKHGEKELEDGSISRQFTRKFILPDGYNIDRIESKLSSDGILTITAPKIIEEEQGPRVIPVQRID